MYIRVVSISLIFGALVMSAVSLGSKVDGAVLAANPLKAPMMDFEPSDIVLVDAFPNLTFDFPVGVEHAGDDRLFIVEQAGRIMVVRGKGLGAQADLFLDLHESVRFGGEMGLLGLAFHPEFDQNGYFYVNYNPLVDSQLSTIISRFQVTSPGAAADPGSEQVLLEIAQPFTNHNGGKLAFGPDGYLYISLGDGGSGGDPGNRAQNPDDLLGKILRIDVDSQANGRLYAIPPDNPFVGREGADEVWALGLRNPWRFSFDRQTGDLFIGDVGQNMWEEIDFQPAGSSGGENYGWRLKEGNHCYLPAENCDPGGVTTAPIFEYSHAQGCSVTGGFVYRGQQMTSLQGIYLFTDYCVGELTGLIRVGENSWREQPLIPLGQFISSFGEDPQGEIYVTQRGTGRVLGIREMPIRVFLPAIGR